MANGNGTSYPPESSFSIINALSIAIVVGYMAAMPMWMWWPPTGVPPEILAIINQMMGAWGMAFGTVIAFHLGSSRSAKDAGQTNRETLNTLASTAATTANTAAAVVGIVPSTTTTTTTVAPAPAPSPPAPPPPPPAPPRPPSSFVSGDPTPPLAPGETHIEGNVSLTPPPVLQESNDPPKSPPPP